VEARVLLDDVIYSKYKKYFEPEHFEKKRRKGMPPKDWGRH